MNISIMNGGQTAYCHSASVVSSEFLSHWQGVSINIEGRGVHWGASEREATLIFKDSDEIEMLIQQLKKAQAELNIKLLEMDAA